MTPNQDRPANPELRAAEPPGAPAAAPTYRGAFAVMTTLFFLWGFMTVWNDILIPRFRDAFTLTYFQSMLVQLAFFGAYFVGALAYFVVSTTSGDPIARIGYKNGIVIGLVISAGGSALFWPAAGATSYPLFLLALFVVGLGFAMLQIAANPYVTILGPERTASSRLNLAQGFNSVGTTIGPLIAGYLIFHYFARAEAHAADSVKVPYAVFCVALLALAMIFFLIRLPHVGEGTIQPGAGALKFPHVALGVVAIFMYVGGEVAVGSLIISFLGQPEIARMDKLEASQYVALYWGGMLIGRFMGAVVLSELRRWKKELLLALLPVAAFLVLWWSRGWGVVIYYVPFLALCWGLFHVGGARAARTLMLFSSMIVLLLLAAILTRGRLAMWCVVAVGLFTSIGWSNTFALAIEGIGIYKSQASSLLVMAILGGAILPPVQGYVADHWHLQGSFLVPLIAYAYVAFYGAFGYRAGRATILA